MVVSSIDLCACVCVSCVTHFFRWICTPCTTNIVSFHTLRLKCMYVVCLRAARGGGMFGPLYTLELHFGEVCLCGKRLYELLPFLDVGLFELVWKEFQCEEWMPPSSPLMPSSIVYLFTFISFGCSIDRLIAGRTAILCVCCVCGMPAWVRVNTPRNYNGIAIWNKLINNTLRNYKMFAIRQQVEQIK